MTVTFDSSSSSSSSSIGPVASVIPKSHTWEDILLKYDFDKSETQPYKQYLSKCPEESDIKCT